MKNNEFPARDDENQVENFESLPTKSAPEALQMDEKERAFNEHNEKMKIQEVRAQLAEHYEDPREQAEKQTPPEEIRLPRRDESSFKKGLKKIMMAFGIAGAMAGAAQAGTAEKNPSDSTDTKGKKEIIKTSENSAEFSDQIRSDWNDYVDWLDQQGLKGNPALDKNDLGGAMIDKYKKLHPSTSISRETIDDVQAEFAKLRQYLLSEIKAGRGAFAPGVKEDNFMIELSKVDNIAGQFTTRHKFPEGYMNTVKTTTVDYNTMANKSAKTTDGLSGKITDVNKGDLKLIKREGTGFVKIKKDTPINPKDIAQNK